MTPDPSPGAPGRDDAAASLAADAAGILEPVFGRLEELARLVVDAHGGQATTSLSEARLAPVQELVTRLVAEDPMTAGMGFVAEPGAVTGHERFMSWWQRRGDRVARLRLNFDPSSIDVYDYLQMEWFQQPRGGRDRVAYGPYVDYSGSELYTVTTTVPVRVGSRFVGVAGADLVVGDLERRLISVLQRSPREAALVGAERRVIAANTARWVVGTRLPRPPAAGGEFAAVADVPSGVDWVVAVAADGPG